MYTQCPDCGISFRVTAVVLKQAAGKVRCGGCGNAFNALAYLSETKPDPATRIEVDESLPQMTPELVDTESLDPPTSISPEQSAALLKTLDQLAGDDIRLEDTGIEWRVLDDDEEEQQEPNIDELLQSSPTRVDQFLTKTPTEVEAGEIFEDPVPSIVEEIEVFEGADRRAAQTSAEELRFDDNTGLPDDFDFDDIPSNATAPPPEPEPETPVAPEPENVQVDLALGDPDEWGELLGEVEPVAEEEDEEEFEEELRALAEDVVATADTLSSVELTFEDELSGIDDPPQEEPPLDIDTQFGMQAEAMGIDLSGIHEKADGGPEFPESTGALEFELEKARKAADASEQDDDDDETSIDEDLLAAAFENEQAAPGEEVDEESLEDEEEILDIEVLEEDIEDDLISQIDGKFDENIENLEIRLEGEVQEAAPVEHVVPPPSEEEQTLNLMIDQDLLSMAVEDEDGFASTIVIEDRKVEEKGFEEVSLEEIIEEPVADEPLKDTASGFETIVMEGDFSGNALEKGKLAGDKGFVLPEEVPQEESWKGEPNYRMIAGIVALVLLLAVQIVHQSRAALATVPAINGTIGPVYRAVGAPITPNWDVAGWRFEVTKGSTNPIAEFLNSETEEADVDAIDDSANIIADEDEILTIYSRIGNQSGGPLPYPLISVALTDRFEEIIGSKVLEPNQYLTGNFDPRQPVLHGETFNAVISVESPAPEATGFKLNVCYRQAGGLLRCAIEDFK